VSRYVIMMLISSLRK